MLEARGGNTVQLFAKQLIKSESESDLLANLCTAELNVFLHVPLIDGVTSR